MRKEQTCTAAVAAGGASAVDSCDGNFMIRTKLVYDSTDSSNSSSASSRRSTVHNVCSFGSTPTVAGNSDNSCGSLPGTQVQHTATTSRHGRTGSMGALDGVLSRFGRQRFSSGATLDGAASIDEHSDESSAVEAGVAETSAQSAGEQTSSRIRHNRCCSCSSPCCCFHVRHPTVAG
jgi:hypothetical protein